MLLPELKFNCHETIQIPVPLAMEIGLNEALLLVRIYDLIRETGELVDGQLRKTLSLRQIQSHFPFWSTATINRIIKRLLSAGYITEQIRSIDKARWIAIALDKVKSIHAIPLYQNDTPHSPYVPTLQNDTPLYQNDTPHSPYVPTLQNDTPLYQNDTPHSPYVPTLQNDTPLYQNDTPAQFVPTLQNDTSHHPVGSLQNDTANEPQNVPTLQNDIPAHAHNIPLRGLGTKDNNIYIDKAKKDNAAKAAIDAPAKKQKRSKAKAIVSPKGESAKPQEPKEPARIENYDQYQLIVAKAFNMQPGSLTGRYIKFFRGIIADRTGEFVTNQPSNPLSPEEIAGLFIWYWNNPRYGARKGISQSDRYLPRTASILGLRIEEFRADNDYQTWLEHGKNMIERLVKGEKIESAAIVKKDIIRSQYDTPAQPAVIQQPISPERKAAMLAAAAPELFAPKSKWSTL